MTTKGGKGRLIKFLISLGCYTWDCIWSMVFRALGRTPKATCVVLYYHSVPDLNQSAFARQMDVVARLSVPISLERIPHLMAGKRYSAITFDDGFEDNIRNAVPELQKRGIPATVFLTTAYLGQFAKWWPASSPEREQKIAHAEMCSFRLI